MRKSCIPNIFTFINLSCGVLSIISIINSNFQVSCMFIILAALVDRYDGRVARYLDVSSDLGKELDSLADLVSFGVAPSILTYIMFDFKDIYTLGILGFILLLLLPICGAYRLARFNSVDFDGCFTGIPITVVGCFIALYDLFAYNKAVSSHIIPIFLILLGSYLMVSNIKLKKF